MGQVPPTSTPSFQPPFVAVGPRSHALKVYEECDAAHSMATNLSGLWRYDCALLGCLCYVKAIDDEVSLNSLLT